MGDLVLIYVNPRPLLSSVLGPLPLCCAEHALCNFCFDASSSSGSLLSEPPSSSLPCCRANRPARLATAPAMADSESSPPHDAARKPKSNSFFSLPGLFVGLTKGAAAPDSDPSRSPTSPLDCKVFSGLGSYLTRSPRSPHCDRAALGLVDALYDEGNTGNLRVLSSATSPRSLPKNCSMKFQARVGLSSPDVEPDVDAGARFREPGRTVKMQPCSMDRSYLARQDPNFDVLHPESKDARLDSITTTHGSLPITTTTRFVGSLSASDIEQSEDYTCIISRGPNPKTTHIFGDCILETHPGDSFDLNTNKLEKDRSGTSWMVVTCTEEPAPSFPSEEFLRVCCSCRKKLEGKDIYMYRGEKAFCSSGCRSQEILVEEEEMEEPATGSSLRSVSCEEEIFFPGMDVAAV